MGKAKKSKYLAGQNYVANGGYISTVINFSVLSLTDNLCVLPRVSASN